jgi:hypothetical protein
MPGYTLNKDISNNILYNFLNLHCIIENDYYILDKESYKKYEFNNDISSFYKIISEYYKKSKKHYIERDYSYNNLLTVIRHICKNNNIEYISKIKYNKSKYTIVYYILKL